MEPADRTVSRIVGGRYRITALVASGGMGEVYAARDQVLDRTVALKILRSNLGADPDFVERFRKEAMNAARLSHPTIVQVYDWGRDDADAYMAMEFVDGQNLREVLAASGPLPPEAAIRIATKVCDALEHARRAGIVHRDIKPENILIAGDGTVKVADFGLARALAESRATQVGLVLGSPAYLSPEQVQGMPVDHRSDIYSLGIVLYEMLTNKPPFPADAPAAIAYRRVNEDVPAPSEARSDVPPALDQVVADATQRNPGDRFASAAEMGTALKAAIPDLAHTGDLGIIFSNGAGAAVTDHTTALPTASQDTITLRRPKQKASTKVKRRRLIAVVAVLLLLAVGLPLTFRAAATTAVPAMKGKTQDAALKALRDLGFVPSTVTRSDESIASGIVISTDPAAGSHLHRGAAITLFVSSGPTLVIVPDVTLKTIADALALLHGKGLGATQIAVFDASPVGTVISQEPASPAVVTKNSKVKLTVSKGPEQIVVPDVVKKSQADATAALQAVGFTVKVVQKEDEKIQEGFVSSQTPKASSRAAKGSEITIVVSTGTPMVEVPDLICMTRAQAADAAAAAGFEITFEGRDRDLIVVDQSPAAHAKAHKGSTIIAQVGFGSRC